MDTGSIHYRRRWFYALWIGLLLLSGAGLFLWERPVRRDLAHRSDELEPGPGAGRRYPLRARL